MGKAREWYIYKNQVAHTTENIQVVAFDFTA